MRQPTHLLHTWLGADLDIDLVSQNLGSLVLTRAVIDHLDLVACFDRHLPADPHCEYTHGQVLATLLAARLDRPTALVHVADWAAESGAELLFGVPADKLNDDRLGRSLDAFFDARQSITGELVAAVLGWAEVEIDRIHYDPTDVTFYGQYAHSQPRPEQPFDRDGSDPAHFCRGYATGQKTLWLGSAAHIDEHGPLPLGFEVYDGNRNGHHGVAAHVELLRQTVLPPSGALWISDRGTFSREHLQTLHRHDYHALCAVPWHDFQQLWHDHRAQLQWQPASFQSQEQQRRQKAGLPSDSYRLAVLQHQLKCKSPTAEPIDCRVLFVHSTAAAREERHRRDTAVAAIRAGLTALADKALRGHPATTAATLARAAVRLLGKRDAARFFQWQLAPLSEAERAALPPPRKGFTRPTHRLLWSFNAVAAEAAASDDGYSILLTTAPLTWSGDALFTQYKRQCGVERLHHELKTPLAVRPVFLKSPRRVEALVHVLGIALLLRQCVEYVYRKRSSTARRPERTTAEQIWRAFRSCAVLVERQGGEQIVRGVCLREAQERYLKVLGLPRPQQLLRTYLRREPNSG
jgi:hypothetical protein